jgi:NAD+ kinase
VGMLIRGENEKETIPECPSWKRISRIVRVGRDLRLMWSQRPQSVLVVKKWNEPAAKDALSTVCMFLARKGLTVLVDPQDPDFRDEAKAREHQARVWKQHDNVDLVVGLGGDGTMLRAIQWLGELPNDGLLMPPVMAFALGSLGFLTPHPFENVEAKLERVLDSDSESPLYCTLRARLRCEVITPDGKVRVVRRALNECLVARGGTSAFQKLDCYVDGQFVAQFQADGVIIATPSGSSAYSMAVGGSLVAPSVPCMLLTPIAPHMLTARPTVLPAGCELELRVPLDARSLPMVSFDGPPPSHKAPNSQPQALFPYACVLLSPPSRPPARCHDRSMSSA